MRNHLILGAVGALFLTAGALAVTGGRGISQQGSFLQSGTGATLRTIESKERDWVTVQDFGAIGGSTDDAAAIQRALDNSPASATVFMPAGDYTANSLITIPKSKKLVYMGQGTFTNVGIRFSDSTTDTTGNGGLECRDRAMLKLANGANTDLISQTNFATLTTTANAFGLFHSFINGCTLDGNKANNASGWCLRLFGRANRVEHVIMQNCASGGQWSEGNDNGFSTPADDLETYFIDVKHLSNGGNGLTFKGPHDTRIIGMINWGNTGWGHEFFKPVYITMSESYLNTSGGMAVRNGGGVTCLGCEETSAAGWGALIDTGAGNSNFAASSFGCNGCVGLEIKSPNHVVQGSVFNSNIGVKFNGGSANMQLNMFSNTTWFDCTSEVGNVIIDVSTTDATGTMKGTSCWTTTERLRLPVTAGNTVAVQAGNFLNGFFIGGWNPVFPASNGTLMVPDVAQTMTATFTLKSVLQANLGTPANGTLLYCSDCTTASACTAAGTGALASRQNGAWKCL